jgi:hypothetical protein
MPGSLFLFGSLLFKGACDGDYLVVGERSSHYLNGGGQSVARLPEWQCE